jgi:hypothetical protein
MNYLLTKSMALLVLGTGATSCNQQGAEPARPNIIIIYVRRCRLLRHRVFRIGDTNPEY